MTEPRWTETQYQEIATDTLALLWDYCDLLAANLDSAFLQWWQTKGEEMRAECLTSVKATTAEDVVDVAGFVSAHCLYLKNTESDEDLVFWLIETVAQIHDQLKQE